MRNGYWSLALDDAIFDTPLDVGQWHDVQMEIKWSSSNNGYIKLWLNGVRQKFKNGSDTYHGRTLTPGSTAVYYKEGMYRQASAVTDIVYHAGFRSSDTQEAM